MKRLIDIEKYDAKIIISGEVLEVYFYEKTMKRMITEELTELEPVKEQETEMPQVLNDKYTRSNQSAKRSQKRMERLINANIGQWEQKEKFITLTFEEYMTREQVLKCFRLFKERLERSINKDYEYIAVIERGGKGTQRLHLHCIFFNLPYIKNSEFAKIWKYGYVKINAVKKHEDLAGYVTKYIEKTLTDSTYIAKGKRFYTTSHGLKKPVEMNLPTLEAVRFVKRYEEQAPDKMALVDNESDFFHTGKMRYIKIGIPKAPFVPKK